MAEKKEYESPYIEIEPGEEDGGARYRLPYGIAKGMGLNTDGMTPRQVWEMLKGKGVNPDNAYKELEKKAKTEVKEEQPRPVGAKLSTKEELWSWGKNKDISIGGAFWHLPENIAIEQASKFVELYEEFPTKRTGKMTFYSSKGILNKTVVAQAEYNRKSDELGINLNSDNFLSEDTKEIEANIKSGWWASVSPENYKYQTVTHEYGHVVEYSLLSRLGYAEYTQNKLNELVQKASYDWKVARTFNSQAKKIVQQARKELFYDKIFPQIFEKAKQYDASLVVPKKITEKGYQTAPKVSNYGTTNWAEYFAESFASGMLGGGNPVGKATVDVVRSIFKGEIKW